MIFNVDKSYIVLSNTIFFSLLLSTILYWLSLILNKNNYLFKLSKLISLIPLCSIFCYLSWRWYNYKFFPLSNLYESLMFLVCLLLIIYKFIEYKTKSKIIGSLVVPISLLIQGFASLSLPTIMQKSSPLVPALQSNWLMLHVSMMMLSYATLILGSLFSLLYFVLYNQNKLQKNIEKTEQLYSLKIESNNLVFYNKTESLNEEKTKNLVNRLRLLENLDNWSYKIIGLGFPFLTIGIVSGAVWANEAWGSYWSWDPKETWALITWLIFAIYLHARITKGWVGKKTAFIGSIGFFIIWICYLGVNFLGKGLHSYGWLN